MAASQLLTVLLQLVIGIVTDPASEQAVLDWFSQKGISPDDLATLVGSLQPPAQPGTEA